MKLLFCEWEAYMQEDLRDTIKGMGIELHEVAYCFSDIEEDEWLTRNLGEIMDKQHYDGVVMFNYFPVMAKLCHKKGIPYIVWVYDSPFNVRNPQKTLGFDTNYIFFFDRNEYKRYRDMGFETVNHLALAVNTKRLDRITIDEENKSKYMCDIAFVGNLYSTDFPQIYARLTEYERGYFSGVIETQQKIYGYNFLKDVLDDSRLIPIRLRFMDIEAVKNDTEHMFADWMRHMTASEITRRERLAILRLLSKRHHVKLYSTGDESLLPDVEYCGTANSYSETPQIYKISKINLNITLKSITSGIPLRVLDILGAGGFLLTNYQPEIAENFVNGHDLVIYDSIEDAIIKAEYYLAHEEERLKIAQNGRKAVEQFTFTRQFEKILHKVYERKD